MIVIIFISVISTELRSNDLYKYHVDADVNSTGTAVLWNLLYVFSDKFI